MIALSEMNENENETLKHSEQFQNELLLSSFSQIIIYLNDCEK